MLHRRDKGPHAIESVRIVHAPRSCQIRGKDDFGNAAESDNSAHLNRYSDARAGDPGTLGSESMLEFALSDRQKTLRFMDSLSIALSIFADARPEAFSTFH